MFNKIPNSNSRDGRKQRNNSNDYGEDGDTLDHNNNHSNNSRSSSSNDSDEDDFDQQENSISAFSGVDYLLDKYKPLIKDVLFLSNISASMGTKDKILVSSQTIQLLF